MPLTVRPFVPTDTGRLRSICCETADEYPFLPYVDEPRFACPFFLDPYLELESESCFVAEMDDHIVGYLAGTRDTAQFSLRQNSSKQRRLRQLLQIQLQALLSSKFCHMLSHAVLTKMYWDVLLGRLHRRPSSGGYFDIQRYPAHCHLQIVSEARGKCVGLALMLEFHKYLKAHGVPGHHGFVVEELGRGGMSEMLLALRFRLVHERQFTSRDVRTLIHPGTWQERILIREL